MTILDEEEYQRKQRLLTCKTNLQGCLGTFIATHFDKEGKDNDKCFKCINMLGIKGEYTPKISRKSKIWS